MIHALNDSLDKLAMGRLAITDGMERISVQDRTVVRSVQYARISFQRRGAIRIASKDE